jgi:hypothetical protein
MKYFMASLVLGVILTVIGNLLIDPNDINAVALYVGFSISAWFLVLLIVGEKIEIK